MLHCGRKYGASQSFQSSLTRSGQKTASRHRVVVLGRKTKPSVYGSSVHARAEAALNRSEAEIVAYAGARGVS